MTVQKQRRFRTFENAVVKIMGALTPQGAGEIIGLSHGSIYAFSDPDRYVLPNVRQSLLLDAAYVNQGFGEPPLLTVYQHLLTQHTVAMPEHVAGDPLERVTESIREHTEAIEAFAALPNKGPIAPAHGNAALQEIEEAKEALDLLAKDIEARMKVVPLGQGSAAE